MRAVVLTGHGGLDKLEYREDWPAPEPGPGEVLVRVSACGLNNTDINTRTAWYSKAVSEGSLLRAAPDFTLETPKSRMRVRSSCSPKAVPDPASPAPMPPTPAGAARK